MKIFVETSKKSGLSSQKHKHQTKSEFYSFDKFVKNSSINIYLSKSP